MNKVKIVVLFLLSFILSFSSVETQITGIFRVKDNLLKITRSEEGGDSFIIDYSVSEKPDFSGSEQGKLHGRVVLEVDLMEVFQPDRSRERPYPYDYRYSFRVKKIISSDNHPNLRVKTDEVLYMDLYILPDQIKLIGLGSFLNSELIREVD